MSEGPWIRFFPSDWLAGTRGMTAAETGIYITLVAMMYERGGPIPNDTGRLARLCGTTTAALKSTLATLVDERKITLNDEGLWNERVGVETEIRRDKSTSARKSAEARWGKEQEKQQKGNANALPAQSARNANQKPEPEKKVVDANASTVRKARGTRISAEWKARENERQWARDNGWSEDEIDDVETRFRDYWLTRVKDPTKTDWDRTFLNRLKDVNERRHPPIRGSPSKASQNGGVIGEIRRRLGNDDGPAEGDDQGDRPAVYPRCLPATGAGGL